MKNKNAQSTIKNKEETQYDDGETEVIYTTKKISAQNISEKELFSYEFTTSADSKMSETMAKLSFNKATRNTLIGQDVDGTYYSIPVCSYLLMNTATQPYFDAADITGVRYSDYKPLITGKALGETNFYMTDVYNKIYSPGDFDGLVDWNGRYNALVASLMPLWAIEPVVSPSGKQFPWTYDLPVWFVNDCKEVNTQLVAKKSAGYDISKYQYLQYYVIPTISSYKYRVRFTYQMPNGNVGSQYVVNYDY